MAEVIMFSKLTAKKPTKPALSDGARREVVVMPGLDMRSLAEAWGFLKRTGRTHNKPRPSDNCDD